MSRNIEVYFNVTRTANYILNHVAFINITQLKHNLLKFVSSIFNHPQYVYPKSHAIARKLILLLFEKKKTKKKNMGGKSVETTITAIVFIVSLHCNQSYARFSPVYTTVPSFSSYISLSYACLIAMDCLVPVAFTGKMVYSHILKVCSKAYLNRSNLFSVVVHHCNQ